MKRHSLKSPPANILIVRLSALGDVVMASGLIRALKKKFPSARLSWLVESPAVPLLAGNPHLDEVIIWPRAQWKKLWKKRRFLALWREARAFAKILRSRKFDLTLDAQGLLKSGIWGRIAGAPRRLTLYGREGSRLLATERLLPPKNKIGIISSEYRFLAEYLGAPPEDFQLELIVGAGAHETAQSVFEKEKISSGTKIAALCPFTTRPQKHWFEDRWIELAHELAGAGFVPVLFGGPGDKDAAARIAAQSPAIVNLTGKLKLDESVSALSLCSVLIGVDTGLTHMGTALKIPTVALFGATRPYLQTGTPLTKVLYEQKPCSPCRRRPTCNGAFDCMREHTVAGVFTAALQQITLARS